MAVNELKTGFSTLAAQIIFAKGYCPQIEGVWGSKFSQRQPQKDFVWHQLPRSFGFEPVLSSCV